MPPSDRPTRALNEDFVSGTQARAVDSYINSAFQMHALGLQVRTMLAGLLCQRLYNVDLRSETAVWRVCIHIERQWSTSYMPVTK